MPYSKVLYLLKRGRDVVKEHGFWRQTGNLTLYPISPTFSMMLGKAPMPRPGYKPQEPNGCGSYFLGLKMDLGIPAMTKCCNQLDVCYDTCGANKYRCDAKFRWCLHSICSDLKRSLGFVSKVEVACDSLVDTVFNTVWTLGCRPFMNSQRAACICAEEEKEEL
ncbi:group XIIB secretory phospholipase A2-like protein isoform X5 [Macaca fascicularis]|uniref:group XIIB secretory phospholipase A2-like protein isoform X5 n=1 Tax=Macaca fascicularis TaxID=9541 RepID=UPI001E2575FD|nr:group XIIB secretory phospholipase A2-like protein isoform X5 [Macaca fascicularis]